MMGVPLVTIPDAMWWRCLRLVAALLFLPGVGSSEGGQTKMPWWPGLGDGDSCSDTGGRVGVDATEPRTARVNAECCTHPGQHCTAGKPDVCDRRCADEFLAFWSECRKSLPWGIRKQLVGTINRCRATVIAEGGGGGASPPPPAPPPAPPASAMRKQGFSGFLGGSANNPASFSCADAQAVGLGRPDTWFYTWTKQPSKHNECTHAEIGHAEFVPMVHSTGTLSDQSQSTPAFGRTVAQWRRLGAKFLLGYNEPDDDGCDGCHHPQMVGAEEAARDWVALQALAEANALTLVSPAMSTTGLDDNGTSVWLDAFFAECGRLAGCDPAKIKYIAYHDYSGDVDKVIGRARGLQRRYGGRQVWLTEVAINEWGCRKPGCVGSRWKCKCEPTRADQDAYLQRLLPALESCDAVFRYVWYTARSGGGNLLQIAGSYSEGLIAQPQLTSTGEVYKAHALAMQGSH
jgi:hypothetical protein